MIERLADIQGGRCLYCSKHVDTGEIDHFVPWSRYPRDLAHNLVLAHKQCNRQKRDLLAGEVPLDRWTQRNTDHAKTIAAAGQRAGIPVDLPATISVAAWAYSHGAGLESSVWLAGDHVEHLTDRRRGILSH